MGCLTFSPSIAQTYPVKLDRKWGLIDRSGKLIASPQYDAIHQSETDHSVVVLKGQYGLLNAAGDELIPPRYTFLQELSDALVLVNLGGNCLDGDCKGGKWGLVHLPSGATIDPRFELITAFDEFGYAKVNLGGDCGYKDCAGGNWGLVDTLANLIVQPIYDKLFYQNDREVFVQTKEGWGLFSLTTDSLLIPPKFQELRRVGPNRLAMREGELYGVVDNFGGDIISPIYKDIQNAGRGFMAYQEGNRYGMMDSLGERILPPLYQAVEKGPYHWVKVKNELWGLANMQGTEVMGPVLRSIGQLGPDYAAVQRGPTWGLIDSSGREIVPVKFPKLDVVDDSTYLVLDRKYYKWYDRNGKIKKVLTFEEIGEFEGNVAKARRKTGWGLVNGYGDWLLPPKFEVVQRFHKVGKGFRKGEWEYVYFDNQGRHTKVKSYVVIREDEAERNLLNITSATSVGWFFSNTKQLWGLKRGTRVVLQPQFTDVRLVPGTSLSIAKAPLKDSEGQGAAVVDHVRGRMLTEPIFSKIFDADFIDGSEFARATFVNSGRYTLLRRNGKYLDIGKASYVGRFQEGLARVNLEGVLIWKDEPGIDSLGFEYYTDRSSGLVKMHYLYCEGGRWGYVDQEGNWKVQAVYETALNFQEGVARIKKDGKWGLVNAEFKEVAKPQYDFIDYLYTDDNTTLLSVGINRSGYGFIDEKGEISILPSFSEVGSFHEGLVRIKENGLWGFANAHGEVVIQPQYKEVGDFHEGRARFRNKRFWGYIDDQGSVIVPESYLRAGDFHGGLAWVQDDKFYGFIGRDGAMVIEPAFSQCGDFHEGLAKARKKGKWGLVDSRGRWVLSPRFFRIKSFSDELAVVQDGGSHGMIDRSGNIVIKPEYREVGSFSDGLAVVRKQLEYGYMNKTGEMVIASQFPRAEAFSCGRAAVFLDGKWGFIDLSGKLVVENRFSKTGGFSESRAAVRVAGKWGFIEPNGRMTVPAIYKKVGSFHQGRAAVYQERQGWGFVNTDGTVVIPLEYDEVGEFQHGVVKVKKNGKWGLLNQYGAPMTMLKYDEIRSYEEGLAPVLVQQRLGVINAQGEEILKPNYDVVKVHGDRVQVEASDKVGYLDAEGKWIWKPSK